MEATIEEEIASSRAIIDDLRQKIAAEMAEVERMSPINRLAISLALARNSVDWYTENESKPLDDHARASLRNAIARERKAASELIAAIIRSARLD